MDTKDIYKVLIRKFTAPEGYFIDDYYGTMFMKLKKNNKYQVKLLYDYSKHAQTSNAVYFETLDMCLKAIRILEEYSKDKKEISTDDELELLLKGMED